MSSYVRVMVFGLLLIAAACASPGSTDSGAIDTPGVETMDTTYDPPTFSPTPSSPPPKRVAPRPSPSVRKTSAPKPAPNCHPSYKGACLKPDASDYDCAGGSGNGPYYVDGPIQVVGYDEYDLDRDGDGTGCDS